MLKKFPKLKTKLVLAPMHEVTNIAFRQMCKKYGAALTWTELISAHAIARTNKSAIKGAYTCKDEKKVVAQIFGQSSEYIVKAVNILEKDFEIIDFNLGCPSKKIIEQGSGGALLRRKNRIKEILSEVSKISKKPFTVKIRIGYDKNEAVEIAKIVEPYVCAITVHARTVKQGYSGKADLAAIKKIKENVNIPIIGNGDVIDGKSAKKMLDETHCDYLMIGRAAIGNPFIFKQINEYLKSGKEIRQTKEERINDFFEYIKLSEKYKIFSIKDAKQKAIEFSKGLAGSSVFRTKLNTMKSWQEIEKAMREI